MIKIELEFPTGAEARQALMELLGETFEIKGKPEISIMNEKIAENFGAPKTEKPVEEAVPKKRQSKAEKALEAVAPAIEKELATSKSEDEKPAEEESKPSAITKEMLQAKAVELIRGGKKDQVTATIKSFDADSISQPDKKPVKVEDYAALMDAFNAIV